MTPREEYDRWLSQTELDPALRDELVSIGHAPGEIEERFYAPLEFGTAGLRGILGAGTNRMNVHVVRRATAGLADYVLSFTQGASRGVAIGYDSRENSALFALEAAKTLAAFGVTAHLFPSLRPVPLLSFAIRHLGCIAGVVVTASHNPPEYNGYKVYWEHGGQTGPGQAEEIYGRMKRYDYFGVKTMDEQEARSAGLIRAIGEDTDEAYYKATASLLQWPALLREKGSGLRLVYTPLHGSGLVPVTTLLARVGISNVAVVPQQELPDPRFPTVKAPNPEDPDAFALAIPLADKEGADAILATDPDSDRMGLAVRDPSGRFQVLSGNKIGCLLLHYLLSSMKEKGTLPADGFAVKSLVSTRMAEAICQRFGVACYDVPTGFRFISEKIDESVRTGRGTFLFGFEESFGFLAGGFSRDKDAVCAAMLAAEACVYYKQQSKTLCGVLSDMAELYGHFDENAKSYTLAGKEGLARIASAMARLRENPPEAFASIPVERAEDLLPDGQNVLRYFLKGGAWMCVRPSGTEPKLKLYIGANEKSAAGLEALLAALMRDADGLLTRLLA
jgi:phosphoglucomutase